MEATLGWCLAECRASDAADPDLALDLLGVSEDPAWDALLIIKPFVILSINNSNSDINKQNPVSSGTEL